MTPEEVGARAPFTLHDYVSVLWRRSWIVLGVTAIVFGVGLYRSEQQTAVYQAEGQVEIVGAANGTDLQTQIGILASPAVRASAERRKPGIGRVRARQDGLGNIVSVTATSTEPALAARTVSATIDAYVAYVQKRADFRAAVSAAPIQGRISRLQTQIDEANAQAPPPGSALAARRDALIAQQSALQQQLDGLQLNPASAGSGVNVIARPDTPTRPIRPNHRTDGLIALGAGLLLGIVLAFFFEYLVRSSRKSEPEVTPSPSRATDVAMVGVLPAGSASGHDVVSLTAPDSPAAQSYRALQGAASFLGLERGRCLAITSAPDRAGKTETVVNLAVWLARSRRRVIVVDCDLRQPRLHELFGLSNECGLTSVMRGERLADALQTVAGVDHLYALTAGPLHEDPVKVLTSDRCREMFASLLVGGTLVLVDTPPVLTEPDICELAKVATLDALMLVASAPPETDERVRQAIDASHRIGASQVGIALAVGDSSDVSAAADATPGRRQNGFGANGKNHWAAVLDPVQRREPITRASSG